MVYWYAPLTSSKQLVYDGTTWRNQYADDSGRVRTVLDVDNVGLATESTLSSINSNIDVALSTRASESTLSTLNDKFSVVSASTTVAAADNTDGVELTLDTGHRKLVHWHVELGDAGEAKVQVSDDGTNWYDTPNSTSLSAAGTWDDWDFIGFRYVKVVVPTTGIDVTILISAKP